MTRDDCINLANQCGMNVGRSNLAGSIDALETFAGLVAEAEREACAKVCEAMIDPVADSWRENRPDEAAHFDTCDIVCQNCADTIRLRSNAELRGAEPASSAERPS